MFPAPAANAVITGNDNSIHDNTVGIDVDGGSATITNNHFYANTTAIQFHNGGTGSVASNSFEGGGSADNGTDLLIENAGVAIGANNAFAGDTLFIDNQSSTDYDLTSNGTTFDESNDFRIEDKVFHKVDDLSQGPGHLGGGECVRYGSWCWLDRLEHSARHQRGKCDGYGKRRGRHVRRAS